MDPFEEFEMKPLTDGLGFHKKTVRLKETVDESGLVEEVLGSQLPTLPPEAYLESETSSPASPRQAREALDELMAQLEGAPSKDRKPQSELPSLEISKPLPRTSAKAEVRAMEVELPTPISERRPSRGDVSIHPEAPSYKSRSVRPRLGSETGVRRSAGDSPLRALKPAPVSLSASLLDAIMVLALSLVFLMSLLFVTKVDLFSVMGNLKQDITTQVSLLVLYLAVFQIYVVISRSFFGKTLGEWTFDFQMGDNTQVKKSTYPILVLWRSIVTIVTGIVTLPLLSFIVRKDLASYLTGLQLYQKRP